MIEIVKKELKKKIGDDKLVDNLFSSFQKISEEFVAQKSVRVRKESGTFFQ